MSQTITVTLPDSLYRPLRRMAQAANQPVDEVILKGLESALPSLADLPPDLRQPLDALEQMSTAELKKVLLETVPGDVQRALQDLLSRKQAGKLTPDEGAHLEALQQAADLVMLRKARAAVLLRFRGEGVLPIHSRTQPRKPLVQENQSAYLTTTDDPDKPVAVIAVYENGSLHPLTPLDLPEQSRVSLQIVQLEIPDEMLSVRQAFVRSGLGLPRQEKSSGTARLSEKQREELARIVGEAGPLSELIIEERRNGP